VTCVSGSRVYRLEERRALADRARSVVRRGSQRAFVVATLEGLLGMIERTRVSL